MHKVGGHNAQICSNLLCTQHKSSSCDASLVQIRQQGVHHTNGRINISEYNFNDPKSSVREHNFGCPACVIPVSITGTNKLWV